MSKYSKLLGDKSILSPDFKYTPAARTDIRDTFRRFQFELATKNQDNNKPLVGPKNNNLDKPLVLNPEAFVLPVEWFDIED